MKENQHLKAIKNALSFMVSPRLVTFDEIKDAAAAMAARIEELETNAKIKDGLIKCLAAETGEQAACISGFETELKALTYAADRLKKVLLDELTNKIMQSSGLMFIIRSHENEKEAKAVNEFHGINETDINYNSNEIENLEIIKNNIRSAKQQAGKIRDQQGEIIIAAAENMATMIVKLKAEIERLKPKTPKPTGKCKLLSMCSDRRGVECYSTDACIYKEVETKDAQTGSINRVNNGSFGS